MWWLAHIQTRVLDSFDWVLYVDDDMFVNVPALMSFPHGIPSHVPMLVSNKWHIPQAPHPAPRSIAFPSGGAGMLFTRPGLQQLGSVLFSPLCEVREVSNDIGWCCKPGNVTKVHSLKFMPYGAVSKQVGNSVGMGRMDAGMAVTVHYVTTREQAVDLTCLVGARSGWPHPQCSVTILPKLSAV